MTYNSSIKLFTLQPDQDGMCLSPLRLFVFQAAGSRTWHATGATWPFGNLIPRFPQLSLTLFGQKTSSFMVVPNVPAKQIHMKLSGSLYWYIPKESTNRSTLDIDYSSFW